MRCTWLGIRHHAHTATAAARQCWPRSLSRLSWLRDVAQAEFDWRGVTWLCDARLSCSSGRRQRCSQPPSVGQLQKIVDGADHSPLGAHFFEPAKQELAEAAGLFDLPEHRLGELLAQTIGAFVTPRPDLRAPRLRAAP